MAKKKSYLNQIYKYDDTDKTYVIEVSLENYHELFNGWDAAPTRKKDLDSELLEFIETAAYDIPMKQHVKLSFAIPVSEKDDKLETSSKTAIYNNFKTIIHFINKQLGLNNRKILTYVTLSFTFITLAYIMISFYEDSFAFSIFREGLFIGGWFLLWESFSLFFFDSYEVRQRRKRFQRYLDSEINFRYIEKQEDENL